MKRTAFFVFNCIISLALAAVCAYVCAVDGATKNLPDAFAVLFSVIFLSVPLSCFLHELGHIICGAAVKIIAIPKFRLFSSSSVKLKPRTDKNLKPKIIFTALGGLAVNLICIILGIVALCVHSVPAEISGILPFSFYLFMLNALPFRYPGGKSDGLIVCDLIKNTDESKVMLAVLCVQAQINKGKPVSEADGELLFGVPQIREDDESFIALTELRYEYCLAKGQTEEAQKYKARFEDLQKYL